MAELDETAPAFVEMAHRIVWCIAGTVDSHGSPRTRVLHPIWQWDGQNLSGWVATSPDSPKARHLASHPRLSFTYWDDTHDTCTADCVATWEDTLEQRRAGWDRFASSEPPVGYDPSIVPGWTSPNAETFGILRLDPIRLRVMPGSLMISGEGRLLTWRK